MAPVADINRLHGPPSHSATWHAGRENARVDPGGAQQAARHSLSNHVSRLELSDTSEGRYFLEGYDLDGRRVYEEEFADPARLEALIGKEAAQRLWRNETTDDAGYPVRVLEGVDLKMGGEGMKGFYDKILPAYAAKFGKRFGAKVGKTEILTRSGDPRAAEAAGLGENGRIVEARNDEGERGYRAYAADGEDLGWFADLPSAVEAVETRGGPLDQTVSVHAMDITPAMRETAIREGFPLFQAGRPAGEPVARLTGRELGDFGDDVVALRAAARDFYARNLRGTTVENPELGTIYFSQRGGRKAIATSKYALKLKLFPALPDIIRAGRLVATEPNRNPNIRPGIKAYHRLEAWVEIDGEYVPVAVTIREDSNGRMYYNHNRREDREGAGQLGARSGPIFTKAGGGTPGDGGTLLQTNVGPDDNLNITLLGEAGEKAPARRSSSAKASPGCGSGPRPTAPR